MELKELQELLGTYKNDMKELLSKQAEELKKYGETTAETAKSIEGIDATIKSITDGMEAAKKRMDELEAKAGRLAEPTVTEFKSPGQTFVESEAYKAVKDKGLPIKSEAVQVKTLITGASLGNLAGYLYPSYRIPEIVEDPRRAARVRSLLNVIPTTAGAIDWIRETGFTNNAAVVAEGEEKPESAITFENKSNTIKTIAHWIPVTKQILADAPGLQAYIDSKLIYGLYLKEDDELLYGTGEDGDIHGITTDEDVQTYSWSDGTAGDTKLDAIRRAMTKAYLAYYPVDGIVLHPSDWEDIELLKSSDGMYVWVNVNVGGQERLWRTPVVVSAALTEGTFLTGSFGLGATLWDRQEVTISVSGSHSDFFIRNKLAILCEERVELTVERPESFVIGTFDSAPAEAS
ncbi:MAG: phage major capsid protein [Thermotogota bacterium]|nr:phage major capsid protein [Thermotogota bacterium]